MSEANIIVVDDDPKMRMYLKHYLEKAGFRPIIAKGGPEALRMLREHDADLVVSDLMMPGMDGMELLGKVKALRPEIPFIMLTALDSVRDAVAAIRSGAHDYIVKPVDSEDLVLSVNRVLDYCRVVSENVKLRARLRDMFSFQSIVTRSSRMKKSLRLAEKVVSSPRTTVAIYGESGTGKEVLARAIHFAGEGLENSFVAVNCAAIPATLLESELFGHVKGAFTGADRDKEGRFELAKGGTLMLDEIGDMPLELQTKLLRVLEEREFERVGSNKKLKADFRVIVATHRDLEKMVEEGGFREDLFHRINVFPIHLPPLRERMEDIPLLAGHFARLYAERSGRPVAGLSRQAVDLMLEHGWPGNIRELKNCIERGAILAGDGPIDAEHLNIKMSGDVAARKPASAGGVRFDIDLPEGGVSLDAVIDRALAIALERCGNNKTLAAEFLKIDRKMFYRRNPS